MNRTYAIGDIHGRDDLLARALHRIHRLDDRPFIITLGDYVDRGPESRGVIDRLMAEEAKGCLLALLGNHDLMMTVAVQGGDPLRMTWWLDNGGDATLKSYGCRNAYPDELAKIPAAHLDWLAKRPLYHMDAYRLFVHAGIEPSRTMEEQDEQSMLWIRGRFFDAHPDELAVDHVVHGHTPVALPELLPHRTNLDTGAFKTGALTIGVFDDDRPGGPIGVWPIDE